MKHRVITIEKHSVVITVKELYKIMELPQAAVLTHHVGDKDVDVQYLTASWECSPVEVRESEWRVEQTADRSTE